MERHFSAGGVVIRKEEGALKVLLIKDSYGRWTWPKGHIEKGEKPEEAALREITEETGLKKISVIGKIGSQEYYFTLEGKRVFKAVSVFLVRSRGADEKLNAATCEIKKAEWFGEEEALERIEYKGSRELLKKGITMFRKGPPPA